MDDFNPAFSAAAAAHYDDVPRGDEDAAADFLARLASKNTSAGQPSTALEFAVGTGRIAFPLMDRNIQVDGIELSSHMVDRLRAKPGGPDMDVIVGDMTTETTGRVYPLVYLVFNTIQNLLTQDGQIECFVNAARHLEPGGVFVVESAPPWAWIRGDQFVTVEAITSGSVMLDVNQYDHVSQILDENHVRISADGIRMGPISCRLIWPSEMDLMARLAGLRLVDRFGGWAGETFTSTSPFHVSVYAAA